MGQFSARAAALDGAGPAPRVRRKERPMGVAALISWFVTAFVGLYLLAVWLIENDVAHRGAAASRLPAPVIVGHVLLALTGLVFWVIHLLSGSRGRLGRGGDLGRGRHPGPDHVHPVDPGAPRLRSRRS